MTPLEQLGTRFKKYRGSRQRCRYPDVLWRELYQLSLTHSATDLAQACGIGPIYLNRKLKALESVSFAEIKLRPQAANAVVELTVNRGRGVCIRFQASHEELVGIVCALSEERS